MEFNIAVCDDEEPHARHIKMLADKWAHESGIKTNTAMFCSAENFKAALAGGQKFDCLLLDIQMGGQNGVELAKELRTSDERLVIVFVTALPDFIGDGYDVFALHYLMKPVNEAKLSEVLDRAAKTISKTVTAVFLPIDGEQLRVPAEEIVYIESFAHFTEVVTTKRVFRAKLPIRELEGQLGENFSRCHRSYIVGLKYVDKITKTDVVLDNGKQIPLSRRLYGEVNRALIRYFTGAK